MGFRYQDSIVLSLPFAIAIGLAVGFRPWEKVAVPPAPGPAATAPAEPAAPAAPPAVTPAPAEATLKTKPSFDVVRVEPDGAYVIAGRADPSVTVTLMIDGAAADSEPTNAEGGFAIASTTSMLPGDHDLTLKARAADGTELFSDEHVTVIISADRARQPVVALADPEAPTRVLQQPDDALEGATVLIRAVEADPQSVSVSGKAAAGQALRIYVDDALIGSVTAGADGSFALQTPVALTAGDHAVRVDQLGADGGVTARSEVSYTYAPTVAVADASAPAQPATPEGMRRIIVQKGDNLWKFSRQFYGAGERYTTIYQANRNHILDPDLIYPGQEFLVPDR